MIINTIALRRWITTHGYTLKFVAKSIGISRQALDNKLSGGSEFKVSEVTAFVKTLGMTKSERDCIFFA